MHDFSVLTGVVVVFGLSILVILACHKARIPPIIGFLLTGLAAGPTGLHLVSHHDVEMLAELGVVLLLFVIGMELSSKELARLKTPVFLGGAAQLVLTAFVFATGASMLGLEPGKAVFVGLLAGLSSTAVALKLLSERAELEAPHGRIAMGILIFQDIAVAPMMLFSPFLAEGAVGGSVGMTLLTLIAKATFVLATIYILAKYVAPRVMAKVVGTRSREVFLLANLTLCFAIALGTAKLGLSLSLGAFLAGLVMAESEYSVSALEGVLPFRDVFTSLFFVSMGMLLDLGYFFSNIHWVIFSAGAVLVLKCALATAAGLLLGYPLRVALTAGFAICQIGEFSFVLAREGMNYNLLSAEAYQLFLAAAVVTMAVTPLAVNNADTAARRLAAMAPPWLRRDGREAPPAEEEALSDHLIIVGYGLGGRMLARAAVSAGIRHTVIEMNPETVKKEARRGAPIAYGDAAQPAVLEHAGAAHARVLTVLIPDPAAVRRVVATARGLNPTLRIIARTRFMQDLEDLKRLGADEVVPEDLETSIEIFTRAMQAYLVPRREIERFTAEARAGEYGMLRSPVPGHAPVCDLGRLASRHALTTFAVDQGSPLEGQSLEEAALRRDHGLMVVAVERAGKTYANPEASFVLEACDVVYVFSEHTSAMAKAMLFTARK